jgi:hypothetical protein
MKTVLAAMTASALASAPASLVAQPAASAIRLASQVLVERRAADVNGAERRVLVVPGEVRSGDRLVVLLRYSNAGPRPIVARPVVLAVPATIDIVPQPGLLVSVDGGRSWDHPGATFARTADGLRPAAGARVTHVRFDLAGPIAPGAGGQFSYRALVR